MIILLLGANESTGVAANVSSPREKETDRTPRDTHVKNAATAAVFAKNESETVTKVPVEDVTVEKMLPSTEKVVLVRMHIMSFSKTHFLLCINNKTTKNDIDCRLAS